MTTHRILSILSRRSTTTSGMADRENRLSTFLMDNIGINILVKNLHLKGDSETRQKKIVGLILEQLDEKGLLVSEGENWQYFRQHYGLGQYSSPEQNKSAPGATTLFDERTRSIRIYLNPHLNSFKPDYQLETVLEEGMHSKLLEGAEKARPVWEDEVSIKNKLLGAADLLEFNQERIRFITGKRDEALAELKIDEPGMRL